MNKRNKSILLLTLVFIFLFTSCSFKTSVPTTSSNINGPLFPAYSIIGSSKKWGYIDSSGKFVIKPKYDNASDFQANNIAIVSVNNKYGLIDRQGNSILVPIYDDITNYSEGYAVAKKDSINTLIDEKGKAIYSSTSWITDFKNGMCLISKNSNNKSLYGFLDKNGSLKLNEQYLYAESFNGDKALVETADNKYHLIDKSGNIVTTYNYNDLNSYSEDTIVYKDQSTNLKGYISSDGKVIINAKFSVADDFKDGFAIAAVSTGTYQPPKYGLIDKNGNYVIKPDYTSITYLGQGLYSVTKAEDTTSAYYQPKAIINNSGTLLTDFKYYEVGNFANGYCSVSDDSSTYFIDKKGHEVSNLPKFSGIGSLILKNNIIKASIDNRLSYTTKANKVIWKAENTYKLSNGISIKEIKYRPNRLNLIYYPEVSGLKDSSIQTTINSTLKNHFIGYIYANDSNTDTKGDFLVDYNKNILVIEQTGYVYPIGAAHGMPTEVYYNIDLNTGKFYKLSDLFKSDSDYLSKINSIIKAAIQKNSTKYFPDAFTGIKPDQGFHVTKDYLKIYFTPYEIAPFAAGYPSFDISWKDIIDVINTDGSFWKSFDKNTNAAKAVINDDSSQDNDNNDINDAISTYETTLVSAINKQDFSIVSPILCEGSNLYNAQKNLIISLGKQGITEKFESFTLEKAEFNSDKTECKAYVDETITINYPKKDSVTKKYSYIYTLKYTKALSKWQLSDIAAK